MTKNPLIEDLDRRREPNGLVLSLPTIGRFYSDGVLHPECDPTAIEVYPVGIAAEVHLGDPLLLASGKAIPKLVKVICPEVIDAESLCGIDIDAILLASRIASHGEKMRINAQCQSGKCGHEDVIEANLQEIILRYAPIEDDQLGKFIVPLPHLDQVVCIQPPTYRTGLEIIRNSIAIEKNISELKDVTFQDFIQDEEMMNSYMEIAERNTVLSISALIDSIFYVETSTGQKVIDKEVITEWALRLKKDDLVEVRKRIQELSEEIDKIAYVDYTCSACGKKNTVRLTLDPQKLFFYEPETSKNTATSSASSKKKGGRARKPSRTSQR